jgi:hypothetical protein
MEVSQKVRGHLRWTARNGHGAEYEEKAGLGGGEAEQEKLSDSSTDVGCQVGRKSGESVLKK